MRHRTLWAAIVAYFKDFRVNRAKESYETAVKLRCTLSGSLEEKLTLTEFYKEQTASIDPWKDHHGFADTRQKYLDAKDDCAVVREKLERQRQTVDRCRQHLNQFLSPELHSPEGLVPVES